MFELKLLQYPICPRIRVPSEMQRQLGKCPRLLFDRVAPEK
jgi:hypothetical protein